MKIAILHEMLIKLGGAEKVVENWSQLYPEAPIYTLMYNESTCWNIFPKEKIHPSSFKTTSQKIYAYTGKQRLSLPFMNKSVKSFDFSEYDLVLVSSSWFAHGLETEAKTLVYYHAPARYMWDWAHEYRKEIWMNRGIRWYFYGKLMKNLRMNDFESAQNNDILIANSSTTQKRIWKYYRRESKVLYPPIETQRFAKLIPDSKKEIIIWQIFEKLSEAEWNESWVFWKNFQKIISQKKYYIILSALTEFKRLDVAIKHFKDISETNLLIIGRWEQRENLEKLAENTQNIFFVWAQFWDDLVALVQNSLGLIFPGEEDFGIVPIEVMAAGKPIFALRKWGLTETVVEWKTWEFFEDSEGDDFSESFKLFHAQNLAWKYLPKACQTQAQKYDKNIFESEIKKLVQDTLN